MLPILLKFGPLTIYAYGFFLALGIFFGTFVIWRKAKEQGYPEDKVLDLVLVSLLAALVSSHVLYVFFVGPFDLISLISFWQGGGIFYGALMGGFFAFYRLCKRFGWSIFEVGDTAVLGLSLGQALGSIGCLFAGCNQPTTGFEVVFYFFLFTVLLYLPSRKKLFSGFLLFSYLIAFSVFRFIIEPFRESHLFLNYLFSVALFIISVIGFYKRRLSYFLGASGALLKKSRLDIIPKKRIVRTWREVSMEKKLPASFIKKMKTRLLRREEKLKQEQFTLTREDPFAQEDRDEDNAELISDTQEQIGHEQVTALKKSVSLSLQAIQLVLKKIKRGKYGICEKCGERLDKARLEAKPTALLCVECERRLESRSP